ncbi:HIT family protein [Mangrovactinospora gilvigrisea]|uniref:HIT family protein n=1 Tax=Mangrovactinospora gilvigrisea TaxID=1428644 RepID=UPI0008FC67EE
MESNQECTFCQIADQKRPAHVVYETSTIMAFFPLSPATKGHTLVVPKSHIKNFLELDVETGSEISKVVVKVGRALLATLAPQGLNVITSAGEAASQTVMHLHMHVVPRWEGDAMADFWPTNVRATQSSLKRTAGLVRAYFK